jgi:ubiquinol-cytochrome c reductase subunit 6
MFTQSDDDEVVDPYPKVREECLKTCPKEDKLYQACIGRISDNGHGDCEAWYIDLMKCADKCIAPKIFKLTKGG